MLREISPNECATGTLLRSFGHPFARLTEKASLPPAQAAQAAARNFFQERIDLFSDELPGRHLASPFQREVAPPQGALNKERLSKTKQASVEPSCGTTAEPGAVADDTVPVDQHRDHGKPE